MVSNKTAISLNKTKIFDKKQKKHKKNFIVSIFIFNIAL